MQSQLSECDKADLEDIQIHFLNPSSPIFVLAHYQTEYIILRHRNVTEEGIN